MTLPSPQRILSMCYVQLDMIEVVKSVLDEHWGCIDARNILIWTKMLKEIFSFARDFNDNIRHRINLLDAGFMRKINDAVQKDHWKERPPSLLNQESQAVVVYLASMARIISSQSEHFKEITEYVEIEIEATTMQFLERFISSEPPSSHSINTGIVESTEMLRMSQVFGPVVISIVRQWKDVSREIFQRHAGWLNPLLFNLIRSNNAELRKELQLVLMKHML
eukprot:g13329.t1